MGSEVLRFCGWCLAKKLSMSGLNTSLSSKPGLSGGVSILGTAEINSGLVLSSGEVDLALDSKDTFFFLRRMLFLMLALNEVSFSSFDIVFDLVVDFRADILCCCCCCLLFSAAVLCCC